MSARMWLVILLGWTLGAPASIAETIRGDEEKAAILTALAQLEQAFTTGHEAETTTLQAQIEATRNTVLAGEQHEAGLGQVLTSVFKNPGMREPLADLANRHTQCLANGASAGLFTYRRLASGRPYELILEDLEEALSTLDQLSVHRQLTIHLAFTHMCDGLPFRELEEAPMLRRSVRNHTHRFSRLIADFASQEDEQAYFARYMAIVTSWQDVRESLQTMAFMKKLNDYSLVLSALGQKAAEANLVVSLAAINEASRITQAAQEAFAKQDFTTGSTLYEAAVRCLFPLRISQHKSTEQLRVLAHFYNTHVQLEAELGTSERQPFRELISRALDAKDPRTYLTRFNHLLQRELSSDSSRVSSAYDRIALKASPDIAVPRLVSFFMGAKTALQELRDDFERDTSFLQSFQTSYNGQVRQRIIDLEQLFTDLHEEAQSVANLDQLQRLFSKRQYLQLVLGYVFEAVVQRYSTVDAYAQVLEQMVSSLRQGRFHKAHAQKQLTQLRSLLDQDTNEHIRWKVYFTRNNLAIGALSGLLIAEVLTLQLEAMPMTLGAIAGISKTVLVTTSALNLLDRHKRHGWQGLANFESAVDALTILCLLPRGVPRTVDATTMLGRTGQKLRNSWALLSRNSAQVAVYLHAGMGAYQLAFAESISERMRQQGVQVSSNQIRQQGLKSLAFSLLFFSMNHTSKVRGEKLYGDAYRSEIAKLKFGNTTVSQAIKSLDPRFTGWLPNGLRNYASAVNSSWQAGGVSGYLGAAWKAVSIPAYHYILANEAVFFSYTTPDFVFEKHVNNQRPLPKLAEGETAVLLIGLDQHDLLYAGARSADYQRHLRAAYGDRFFVYDFDSPHDFFNRLYTHALEHGPVKHLKVVTHGIPGLLATKSVEASPLMAEKQGFNHYGERGYISTKFIRNNRSWIHPKAEVFMAPDAHAVLISCLVGGNYEDFEQTYDANHKGQDNIGDLFLDEFSETLLARGGRLDASTRALVGVDMIYSSLIFHGSLAREYEEESRRSGVLPIKKYKLGADGQTTALNDLTPVEEESEAPQFHFEEFVPPLPSQLTMSGDETSTLLFSAKRFAKIMLNFPKVAYTYGIALEGPAWGERYKFRIVHVD